jgi:hypothetical protein
MANVLYPKGKQALLNKEHNLSADAIKATLIDGADYTYGATHNTYVAGASGVADVAKVAVSAALTSPTITDGVFDTADFSWTAVSGDVSEDIILWNDTPTTPTADPLLAFYDTGMTGMPVTPNGGNINVTVHASGWFAL